MARFRQPVSKQLRILEVIKLSCMSGMAYRTTQAAMIGRDAGFEEFPKHGDFGSQIASDSIMDLFEQGEVKFITEDWRDYCYVVPADFDMTLINSHVLVAKPWGLSPRAKPRR